MVLKRIAISFLCAFLGFSVLLSRSLFASERVDEAVSSAVSRAQKNLGVAISVTQGLDQKAALRSLNALASSAFKTAFRSALEECKAKVTTVIIGTSTLFLTSELTVDADSPDIIQTVRERAQNCSDFYSEEVWGEIKDALAPREVHVDSFLLSNAKVEANELQPWIDRVRDQEDGLATALDEVEESCSVDFKKIELADSTIYWNENVIQFDLTAMPMVTIKKLKNLAERCREVLPAIAKLNNASKNYDSEVLFSINLNNLLVDNVDVEKVKKWIEFFEDLDSKKRELPNVNRLRNMIEKSSEANDVKPLRDCTDKKKRPCHQIIVVEFGTSWKLHKAVDAVTHFMEFFEAIEVPIEVSGQMMFGDVRRNKKALRHTFDRVVSMPSQISTFEEPNIPESID
jgi:hypothetical protein